MRRLLSVGCITALLAAPLAALGAEPVRLGPPPRQLTSPQLVQQALTELDAAPHRLRITGRVGFTFRQRLSPLWTGVTDEFQAIAEVENTRRAAWSLSDAATGHLFSAAMIDGAGYVAASTDAYERLGPRNADSLAELVEPARQVARPRDLAHVTELRDLGPELIDGAMRQHFTGRLSAAYARGVARALAADRSGRKDAIDLSSALDSSEGTLDIWLSDDGRLWRQSVSTSASIIPSKAGAVSQTFDRPIGAGTVTLTATFQPFDVGQPIAVATPEVPREVVTASPSDIYALVLLFGAESTADTYARVTGSYARLSLATLRRMEPGIRWTRRSAQSARDQVRLVAVAPRRVMFATRTPSGREYRLVKAPNGRAKITCRITGRPCRVAAITRVAAHARTAIVEAVGRAR